MNLRFSISVFFLSSHWVRRFFTDQSITLASLKRPCLLNFDGSTINGLTRDNLTSQRHYKVHQGRWQGKRQQWRYSSQFGFQWSKKPAGGRRSVSLTQGVSASLHLVVWPFAVWTFAVRPHWELNSTLFQSSPSSHHTPLVFPFLSLVQVGRFFHWRYLWSFGFLLTVSNRVLEVFHRLIILSSFLLQSPSLGSGVFLPVTWSLLRLISFSTGLGYSHWFLGFSI